VSVSAGRSSIYGCDWSPSQAAELAAAIATVELSSSNRKRARYFAELSLLSAHDNSVAQVVDLQKRGLQMPEELLVEPIQRSKLAFEARARQAYDRGDWSAAWLNGSRWQADQPFASNAARFMSFIGIAALHDPLRSLEAAELGLPSNPDHAILHNNIAFAHLVLGNIEAGWSALNTAESLIRSTTSHEAAVLATRGLLQYRLGDLEGGHESYRRSHRMAEKLGETTLAEASLIFHEWIRAELGLGVVEDHIETKDSALRALQGAIRNHGLTLRPLAPPQSPRAAGPLESHIPRHAR